jgi:hypothetical protein
MRRTASERASPRGAAGFAALAAATLLLGFLLRYPSFFEPRWYGDEGIFAAVAQNMRSGHALYGDSWDNKPPLIFYTYAAVQSLFGSGVMPLHIVTTIVVLTTQAVVMLIALVLFGRWRALGAGMAFAFVLGTPVIEGNLAMTETYMILPTSLAVLASVLATRRPEDERVPYYAASGVLIGMAAGYKQVAVFDGAAIGTMVWLTHERPLRAVVPLVLGAAIPQAALALLYLATGAFGAYWYAIVGSLGVYSEFGETRSPLVAFIGYLPAIVAVAWLVRRKQQRGTVETQAFPALWLGFALAGATSSTFAFPHYLQQAAPAAALALVSMPWRWERDESARMLLAVGAVLSVAVVFGQFAFAFEDRRQVNPIEYYRTYVSHRYGTMSDQDYDYYFDGKVLAVNDIVEAIHDDGRGTSVYTWSELPWIYAAGGLTNPTRYYTSFLGEVIPGAKEEILRDLQARPPAYIVMSDDTYAPFDELWGWLRGRYSLVEQHNDWWVYRLDAAATQSR